MTRRASLAVKRVVPSKSMKLALVACLCAVPPVASAHPRRSVAQPAAHAAVRHTAKTAGRTPHERESAGKGRTHAGTPVQHVSSHAALHGRRAHEAEVRATGHGHSAAHERLSSYTLHKGHIGHTDELPAGHSRNHRTGQRLGEEAPAASPLKSAARSRIVSRAEVPSPSPLKSAARSRIVSRAEVPSPAEEQNNEPTIAATDPQPLPNVHHNRKIHHTANSDAVQPEDAPLGMAQPIAYHPGGRVPPAMKGSREILLHQNLMADEAGLRRVQDDADLQRMRATRELVALPVSRSLQVDDRLPENRRFTRPWVAAFLTAISRAHAAQFGTPLQVNSAVRTVEFQVRLMRINGNAAAAGGDLASPHLTGQAVDLAKKGLTPAEVGWMRQYLLPLVAAGVIDVEEEFQQACFHISVYPAYLPGSAPQRQPPAPAARVPMVLATATAAMP